jgi:hypothetical protein
VARKFSGCGGHLGHLGGGGQAPEAIGELRKKKFFCSDQTQRGHTSEILTVECDTFCITAYGKNTFMEIFIHYPLCMSVGCAKVHPNGTFINDVKDRLGLALDGKVTVYSCDDSSFKDYPKALQSKSKEEHPCNWFNPHAMSFKVKESEQVCVGLPVAGTDYNHVSWLVKNGPLLAIMFSMMLCFGGFVFLYRRCCKKKQAAIDNVDSSALLEGQCETQTAVAVEQVDLS